MKVEFYGHGWAPLGTRRDLARVIESLTGIHLHILATSFTVTKRRMEGKTYIAEVMS